MVLSPGGLKSMPRRTQRRRAPRQPPPHRGAAGVPSGSGPRRREGFEGRSANFTLMKRLVYLTSLYLFNLKPANYNETESFTVQISFTFCGASYVFKWKSAAVRIVLGDQSWLVMG